jgi:hypothetical protein
VWNLLTVVVVCVRILLCGEKLSIAQFEAVSHTKAGWRRGSVLGP